MALRLGPYIEYGEFYNSHPYSVHGYLKFWGHEMPLHVELTGTPAADLAGKAFCFEARQQDSRWEKRLVADRAFLKQIAMHQVGPTGTMTAALRSRVPDCSVEEFEELYRARAPIPNQWKRCLYLEWFSQNGRVVVELVDPKLEMIEGETEDGEPNWVPFPDLQPEEAATTQPMSAGPCDCTHQDSIETLKTCAGGTLCQPPERQGDELELWLEQQAEEVERQPKLELPEECEDEECQCELVDNLIESDAGVQLRTLLDKSVFEHDPMQLSEQKADSLLKAQLAKLALFGIGLHVCEHFGPREALGLLMDKLGREARPFPALRGTGWVTSYLTAEFCPACEAEAYEKYQKWKSEGKDEG